MRLFWSTEWILKELYWLAQDLAALLLAHKGLFCRGDAETLRHSVRVSYGVIKMYLPHVVR